MFAATLSLAVGLLMGTASAGPVPDGMAGNGTAGDPYVITNATELQAMNENLSAHYVLGNDIEASGTSGWNGGSGFDPVGNDSRRFNGSFDGWGHTITDLTIDRPDEDYVGLFGASNGSISNVTLADVEVHGGENYAGGLVGQSHGSVSHSSVSGTVTGNLSSPDPWSVGGLVGSNFEEAVVEHSSASVTVEGVQAVGGLVGENYNATVRDSSATADVDGTWGVGGVVGYSDADSGDSATVANTSVTSTVNGSEAIGGLVGHNGEGTVNDSSATVDVTGVDLYVGGLVGENVGGTVRNGSVAGTVTSDPGSFATGGLVGYSDEGATISNSSANVTVTGDVSVGGVVGEQTLGATVRNTSASGTVTGTALVGGLIGQGLRNTTVIASSATGNVSGEEHVGGLVGRIVDAPLINESFATGTVNGSEFVGGLVGENRISDPTLTGGTINTSYATGNVSGTDAVGGLVGANRDSALIRDSFARGDVDGTTDVGGLVGRTYVSGNPFLLQSVDVTTSYATGNVTGADSVGGLVGNNTFGEVNESFATGAVTGVGGATNVGGLVGANDDTVTDSYWDVNATGQPSSDGGTGLPTANVTGIAAETNMTGFDFDANWSATDAYPHLQWEIQNLTLELGETAVAVDSTTQATVTLTLADDSAVTATGTADYSSDNASVASVADDGTVQSVAEGAANVTATLIESDTVLVSVVNEYAVSGTVTDGVLGDSVENATVAFDDGADVAQVTTNASGGYDLTLPAGTYAATATAMLNGRTLVGTTTIDLAANTTDFNVTLWDDLPGSGTPGDPYVITNVSELQSMRGNLSAHYVLGTDVDASNTSNWNGGAGFDPVGEFFGTSFTGSFDGAGHTITDLTVNRSGENVVGLFGSVQGGTIEDVTLENVSVNGSLQVGGLVGVNNGDVTDSNATGAVTGQSQVGGLVGNNDFGTVTASYTNASVTGTSRVGGLVGHNSFGTVTASHATGTVTGVNRVGGLVGETFTSTSVRASYATGAVIGVDRVGGLVGRSEGDIADSFAAGTVTGEDDVGGLIGHDSFGTVTASHATGTVTGEDDVGGLVGQSDGDVEESNATGAVAGDTDVGGLVGFNQFGTVTASYATGAVTGEDDVGGLVGENDASVSNVSASGDVGGSGAVGGLVGNNGGTIDASSASGDLFGAFGIGGLVGENEGTLEESFATGTVTGISGLGGLVGLNEGGTVHDSFASGAVDGSGVSDLGIGGLVGGNKGTITDAYAVGAVAGDSSVGGLVGNDDGTVTDSYWDTETTGQPSSDGGTGLTTAEMSGAAAETNLAGFDFGSDWTTTDDYPHLRWAVQDLTLALGSTTIEAGDATAATVTLSLADSSTVTASSVANYSSDDETVATVAADGTVTGLAEGTATITATLVGSDAVTVTVQGSPDVATNTTTLDFDPVEVGLGSSSRTMVIENDGTLALNVTAVTVTGANASEFAITAGDTGLPVTLASGTTHAVTVEFAPDTTTGPRMANLTLQSDDPDEPTLNVSLTGTAQDTTDPTADAGANQTVDEDTAVSFGGSNSTDNGQIASYAWDFGDGNTSTGPTTNHTYVDPGTYTVNLTVTDGAGNADTDSFVVTVDDTTAPVADAGSNQTVDEDTVVSFDASASTDDVGVVSYAWDFGDGSATGSGSTTTHTYADPGTYTVTLTVTDTAGNDATDSLVVTVNDTTAPVADAGADQTVDEDAAVSFDASGSTDNGVIDRYDWGFGDGTNATGSSPTHTYADPGTYTVDLTVTDTAGNAATDSLTVVVQPASGGGSGSGSVGGGGGAGDDDDGDDDHEIGGRLSIVLVDGQATFDVAVAIRSVEITFADDDASGTVTAEPSDELPDGAEPVPDAMGIAFVDITVPPELADSAATIRLTLDGAALGDLDPSQLAIYRYHGGGWTALETVVDSTADGQVILEARTPGFSLFTVAPAARGTTPGDGPATPDDTTPEDQTATSRPDKDGTTTPGPGTQTRGPDDGTPDRTTATGGQPGFGWLAALVGLLVAVRAVARRRP